MKIGDKVLFKTTPEIFPEEEGCKAPQAGNVYTIRQILFGGSSIYVEEIINPVNRYWGGVSETNTMYKGQPISSEPAWALKHFDVIK